MGDVSLNPQPLINDEPLTLPATAAKDNQVRDLMSSGWTNEQHSSYISYMEASFMDQLYGHQNHGLDVNKRHLGDNGFKVMIQEGLCNNIKFERNHLHHDARINCLPENPLVRRFRPRGTGASRRDDCFEAMEDDYGSGTDMVREKVRMHRREVKTCARQNLIGKSKEVSDQNFPDEEAEASNEPSKKQRPTSSSATPNDPGT
ncbi:uncharacterized protein LOC120691948 isoform X1 [Panicum virgatum]|uniref:Uncharacterized protein n=1 Tax=Panicum virgatum TaxID=38727 RepID=A0A8T0MS89_PANVG|nr:uncharacterized protein LOC120691948 isoform X1 [Panicum virgatum]KAG2538329.1 hypothetical protein PVAP13_9NG409900 [Panicum virgatum]